MSDIVGFVATVGIGVLAGGLSALLGVGGAVVTTPAVRVLGATPIEAVGSTVPAILPGALAGAIRYSREGLVDWRLAIGLGASGSVFALLGAVVSSAVNGRLLMVGTAALMMWSGLSVARAGTERGGPGVKDVASGHRTSEDRVHGEPSLFLLVLVGALSGFVAGLLGVGGGIVIVPLLSGPFKLPMKSAVASSLVAVAAFSVPALVGHTALGHVNWAYAIPLTIGVVPGSRLGAQLTLGASDHVVRTRFGMLIVALAIVYGISELRPLI